MYVSDGGRVNITEGLIENNVAARRGAAVSDGKTFNITQHSVTLRYWATTVNRSL